MGTLPLDALLQQRTGMKFKSLEELPKNQALDVTKGYATVAGRWRTTLSMLSKPYYGTASSGGRLYVEPGDSLSLS